MNDFTLSPSGALIAACAFATLMLALILWRTSMSARERAKERARIWGELKRADWNARAERARVERASGERAERRLRASLMSAVALVALASTNLSAHGTINAMARVGLDSIDTAVSVIIVFEMFLAILGALSWWHMNRGTGFNWYELGVWAMASLMGGVSWWGSGVVLFALWPLLAAVAWHVVVTFGRERHVPRWVLWARGMLGKTSRDQNAVDTERRINKLIRYSAVATTDENDKRRARYERKYRNAYMRADALGIITAEVIHALKVRAAAYHEGARALAPEAVAHLSPWSNERALVSAHLRAERSLKRSPKIVSAHEEVSAHSAPSTNAHEEVARIEERAPEAERALKVVRANAQSAHSAEVVLPLIADHFAGGADWAHFMPRVQEHWKAHRDLPTAVLVAAWVQEETGKSMSAANCRKWLTPIRAAMRML